MDLLSTITADLTKALKEKDALRLSVLRMVQAEIKNQKIKNGRDLSDEDVLSVVQKQVKLRDQAIAEYQKASRQDLLDKEELEKGILLEYLPKQLTDEELEKIVDEVLIAHPISSPAEIGKLIGLVMPLVKGLADGKRVSEIIRRKI